MPSSGSASVSPTNRSGSAQDLAHRDDPEVIEHQQEGRRRSTAMPGLHLAQGRCARHARAIHQIFDQAAIGGSTYGTRLRFERLSGGALGSIDLQRFIARQVGDHDPRIDRGADDRLSGARGSVLHQG